MHRLILAMNHRLLPLTAVTLLVLAPRPCAQQDPPGFQGQGFQGDAGRPGGFPGGPGGPGGAEIKLVARFDADGDGRLDATERATARVWLKENPQRRGPGGPGPMGRGPGGRGPLRRGTPGAGPDGFQADRRANPDADRAPTHVDPAAITNHPDRELYDPETVRTLFLRFDSDDWFDELAAFYRTDVEVPATMLVDGKEYHDVGVGFRGNSSYFGVPGKKKSFAIAVDANDPDQKLLGHSTLNLLNGNEDPTFLHEAIHAFIARRYMPALQSNLVHLVVNGESFGIYANTQQFNNDFIEESYGTRKGVRWKVPANPMGAAGLAYLGDDKADYERVYQIKSSPKDESKAWEALIGCCRLLEETADADLERELPKVLDIDTTLWFLAVDAALLDGDGYYSRASDFVIWQGPDGRFRPLPYDSNEILGAGMRGPGGPPGGGPDGGGRRDPRGGFPPGGRGPGGMMGGASPTSGPLALTQMRNRPLARLLEVPAWRAAFLSHLRAIAVESLDWNQLGAFCGRLHQAIDKIVQTDEKAIDGYEEFARSLDALERTVTTRRKTILEHESMRGDWPAVELLAQEAVASEPETSKVHVTARVGAGKIGAVTLHLTASRTGSFASTPMFDDGLHGDGRAGDGVFGATMTCHGPRAWLYVEAWSAGDGAQVAFAPAGAGALPQPVQVRKQR